MRDIFIIIVWETRILDSCMSFAGEVRFEMKAKVSMTVLLTGLLLGCAQIPIEDIRHRNVTNLGRLQIGMSQDNVNSIMGTGSETVVEKVYHESCLSGYRRLEVANPYKTEVRKVNDETYEVLYYYADNFGTRTGYWDPTFTKGRVPDYILTPLVFEKGELVGWGREYAEEKDLIHEDAGDGNESMLYGR
jgi:hypothetical protein